MQIYLNTEEAAAYLGIKERKLYELVAKDGIPCSKVTGKWLFPRAALDRWVEAGLARPHGLVAAEPPPIVGGSHDPLLEWALRRSSSGLALLSEGSEAGLMRLGRNEAAMAAIHLHGLPGADARANIDAIMALPTGQDIVLIAFARREQGLVVPKGNPKALASLTDAVRLKAQFGLRQDGAGAQQLLEGLLGAAGLGLSDINRVGEAFATGEDLAFAVRAGDIDCGVASRAVASGQGLDFVPLAWEHFDLALRRRTFFEPGPQRLFALLHSPEFHRHAELLGGYDTAQSGAIRWNR